MLMLPAMFGGGAITPWLIVGALGTLIVTNGVTAYYAFDFGQNDVQTEWNQEKASRATKALEVTNKHNAEVRENEQRFQNQVTSISTDLQKQLQEKDHEIENLRRDVLSGKRRLSAPVMCPERTVGVGVSPAPGTTSGRNGEERVELPPAFADALLSIGRDADNVARQLGACQKVVESYYAMCGPQK